VKAAPFALDSPGSVAEALDLLAAGGEDAKVIAGGQSLIPLLALRFAEPSRLVDLNRISELAGIRALDDGGVAIGAMTRTRELELSPLVAQRARLAAQAAPLIAHRQIRNRGTVGGSLAHADPAAELPAVMLVLGATLVAEGPGGTREIAAEDFFQGFYTTALAPDEILTEIRIPPPAPGTGTAFTEMSRRRGDFAIAGVAAAVTLEGGACVDARVAITAVADRPMLVEPAAELLRGRAVEDAAREVAAAAAEGVSPPSDVHASSEYRHALVAVLVERALREAAGRA
jgi:carbon-monoxide dehydrogenase medium subunit